MPNGWRRPYGAAGVRKLLARAGAGLVRDGHGDLRAEHVCSSDGIEIVDCVEFDPGLREQDSGWILRSW